MANKLVCYWLDTHGSVASGIRWLWVTGSSEVAGR